MRNSPFIACAIFLLFLVLTSWQARAQEHHGCAQVKSTTKFFSDELNQQVLLSAGRILPFRRTGKSSQVEIFYKSYWIKTPADAYSYGPKNSCFVQQPCARVIAPTGLYKDIQTKPQKITTAVEKEQFPITGVQQIKGKTFYQVDLGDDFAWILANKVDYKKESCGLAQRSERKWNIQVEFGQGNDGWRNQYSSVWSKDFASQDLQTVRDPIIVPQSSMIQRIDARWIWKWTPTHHLYMGVDYTQRAWLLKNYANFRTAGSPPSCPLVDPIITEIQHKDSLAGLSFGYQWQALQRPKWSISTLTSISSRYVMNNQFNYPHRIPCATQKNATETTPDWEFGAQLGFQWLYRFSSWATGLGLYVNDQMKPFVGLILQF